MKRLILMLLAASLLCLPVLAAQTPPDMIQFDFDEQLGALGAKELEEQVPEQAQEMLEQTGLREITVEGLLGLSPREFFPALWQMLLRELQAPARTLGVLVGIVVLCALLGAFSQIGPDSGMNPVFALVATMCVLLAVSGSVLGCVVWASQAIEQMSTFMLGFIPVFSAAAVAAGQPATGMAYNSFLFVTCQIVSQVIMRTLVPLLSAYLALCIVGSLVPELNISGAAGSIKTVVSWILGFLLTLFIALLSLQSMVSGSADTVGIRAGKFLLGNFVPVVGGALSDALGAAQGCLKLIKTTVGVYGVIVALFTFVPVLLRIIIWMVISNAAAIAGDIMGVESVSSILKACSDVLGLLMSVVICYGLLLIISTTVVIVTGLGA